MFKGKNKKPVVLVISGHDPSGGAGIQADIESIVSAGCHATTIITALTAQNTNTVAKITSQNPVSLSEQIKLLLDDINIAACKIGMIPAPDMVDKIQNELLDIKIPVVLDPIINSGSGENLSTKETYEKIKNLLFPLTTIITPNTNEAKILTNSKNLDSAADELLNYGTESVLITGEHNDTSNVINTLYRKTSPAINYTWERLPGMFHGSGCTLSSRIAANLALGGNLEKSVQDAQEYTWKTLKHALSIGKGQNHPNRFFKK